METICDSKQIQGLVRERNQYRQTLEQCLHVLNTIPNTEIPGLKVRTTYKLASAIESVLKQSEPDQMDKFRFITWSQLKKMSRRGRKRIARRVVETTHDGYWIN